MTEIEGGDSCCKLALEALAKDAHGFRGACVLTAQADHSSVPKSPYPSLSVSYTELERSFNYCHSFITKDTNPDQPNESNAECKLWGRDVAKLLYVFSGHASPQSSTLIYAPTQKLPSMEAPLDRKSLNHWSEVIS